MGEEAQERYELYGVEYPLVVMSDWRIQDFVLARQLTRLSTGDMLDDYQMFRPALVAVAMWHKQPDRTLEEIIGALGPVKPSEIRELGFKKPDGDAQGPPDGPPAGSSDGSATATDPAPET